MQPKHFYLKTVFIVIFVYSITAISERIPPKSFPEGNFLEKYPVQGFEHISRTFLPRVFKPKPNIQKRFQGRIIKLQPFPKPFTRALREGLIKITSPQCLFIACIIPQIVTNPKIGPLKFNIGGQIEIHPECKLNSASKINGPDK